MTRSNIKYLIVFCILSLFSSCATLLNNPVQKIFIATDNKVKVISVEKNVLVDSSLMGINAPRAYYIIRSNNSLKVNLEIDSIKKAIFLHPRNSFAYWFNIYCNYGIGMLVDKNNTRRYSYPVRNYLTVKDTSIKILRFAPINKGTINLSLSLPFTTIFSIKTTNKQYISAGIFGFEAGLDYFYQKNRYISMNIGVATDKGITEYFGPGYIQIGNTIFTSVRNNYVVGSFDFGYGINVSQLKWIRTTIGDTINLDQSKRNIGLGLSFSTQYRVGNYFRLGVLYQPNLLNTGFKSAFHYQHYISLNLIWKLPINNID